MRGEFCFDFFNILIYDAPVLAGFFTAKMNRLPFSPGRIKSQSKRAAEANCQNPIPIPIAIPTNLHAWGGHTLSA